MNNTENLNKLRTLYLLAAMIFGVVGILGPESFKFYSSVVCIILLVVGNILNFLYVKKLNTDKKNGN
jgi:hypothetical protein